MRERALRQNPGDMPLIIRSGVDIAGWLDHPRDLCGSRFDRRVGARLPDQGGRRRAGIDRRLADAAQREPHPSAPPFPVEDHDRRDARQGKITAPARHFHEACAGAGLWLRKCDLHQHLIDAEIGGEQPLEKLRCCDFPASRPTI